MLLRLYRFIALAFLLLPISCTTYRVMQVEVLEPAAVPLAKGSRVAFFDRNIQKEGNAVQFADPGVGNELQVSFGDGMNHCFVEMGYDTVMLLGNHRQMRVADIGAVEALPEDTVRAFCRRYDADFVASLEMMAYGYEEDDILCQWFLRLYGAEGGMAVDSVVFEERLPEESFTIDSYDLLDYLAGLFWDAGVSYARRLVPTWNAVERRIYRQGRVLALGEAYWRNGQDAEAEEVWQRASRLSGKTAVQAYVNLAWLQESREDFARALELLREAERIVQEENVSGGVADYVDEYIRILEKRLRERDILSQQMDF